MTVRIDPTPRLLADAALKAFDEFVHAWIGPAAHPHIYGHGNIHEDKVRRAIQALAEFRQPTIGYAAFNEHLDPYRERALGYAHTIVSGVFDDPPAEFVHNLHKREPGKHFIIGAIEQFQYRERT